MRGSTVSCALCLIEVEIDYEVPSGAHRCAGWMYQFRALYAQSPLSTVAHLSGAGRRIRSGDTVLPCAGPGAEPVPGEDGLEINLMRSSFGRQPAYFHDFADGVSLWGFPFHASCWTMLCLVRPGEAPPNLQALFDVCRSTPVQARMLNYGHDYGGWAQYQSGRQRIYTCEEKALQYRDWDLAAADPLDVEALRHAVDTACLSGASEPDDVPQTRYAVALPDAFSVLPPEVLQHTLELLPSADVVRLKQASKTFANLPLQQSFWRSRFLPGGELEAVFEARARSGALSGRWRALYRSVRFLRELPEVQIRERIWGLGCLLRGLADAARSAPLEGDDAGLEGMRWMHASRALNPMGGEFYFGSRELHRRTIPVPRGASSVAVSWMEICGKRYVASVRLDEEGWGSSTLGYRHSVSEAVVTPGPVKVGGFHLALDGRGVRALAVVSTDGVASSWAGDPSGVPVRRLVLPTDHASGPIRYLKGGFDALKLVSLSISDGGPVEELFDGEYPFTDTSLWAPSLPAPDIHFLGMDPRHAADPNLDIPITVFTFGSDPRTPGQIRGIEVQYGLGYRGIVCIEVRYADGIPPRRIGRQGKPRDTESTSLFRIDGAHGEYVTGIEAYYWDKGWLFGFRIHTSSGREADIPSGCRDRHSRSNYRIESLIPKNGTVVGFCSRTEPTGVFPNLGIVYTTARKKLRPASKMWESRKEKGGLKRGQEARGHASGMSSPG